MQQIVYLAVALAVAAAILSLAVAMKAVLPAPEAPLEHAEALVYVKVRPLNGSYWLGVHAPYGDVEVRQVRINNAVHSLGITAPVGREVWLNASGRPLTVNCNSTVELVTAKGGATRSLSFTVQCPQKRPEYVDVESQSVLELYAVNTAKYLLQFDEVKLTIKRVIPGVYKIINISPEPVLLVFNQVPRPPEWVSGASGRRIKVYRDFVVFDNDTLYKSIGPSGSRVWYYGREIDVGLGGYPRVDVNSWVRHVYLPPGGYVETGGSLVASISAYPVTTYNVVGANNTSQGKYFAALSPWRRITIYRDGNRIVYLNASGFVSFADKPGTYAAYGNITLTLDEQGNVYVYSPYFGGSKKVTLPFTYYVSNAPYAYNYVFEIIDVWYETVINGVTYSCREANGTLYKLSRDWSNLTVVAHDSFKFCRPVSGGGGTTQTYFGCSKYTEYGRAVDIISTDITDNGLKVTMKVPYVVKDCTGKVYESGYKIVTQYVKAYTPGMGPGQILTADPKDTNKFCTYGDAHRCKTDLGQEIIQCTPCETG